MAHVQLYILSNHIPLHQKPAPPKPGGTIAVLQNIPLHSATKINVNKVSSGGGKAMTVNNKSNFPRSSVSSAGLSTVLTPGKSLLKEKEKKSSAFSQPFGDDKMAGDDDINDVAAMGGVNLAEETQRILGSTEMIGTQIRCMFSKFFEVIISFVGSNYSLIRPIYNTYTIWSFPSRLMQ